MIPDADIVAFSTSVSNHWSRKSTALIVISWTWLYLSSSESDWKRRARNRRSIRPRGSSEVGSGGVIVEDRLDEAAHLDHRLAVLVVRFGVDLRMTGDLPARLGVVVHAPQVVAVRHRRERAVERQDLQAVSRQVELADDLRPQQRHDVGADRVLEAGEDLLGDRGAAEHVPALDHEHLAARPRQIRGVDQPVVAPADHDHVVVGHKIRRAKTPGGVRSKHAHAHRPTWSVRASANAQSPADRASSGSGRGRDRRMCGRAGSQCAQQNGRESIEVAGILCRKLRRSPSGGLSYSELAPVQVARSPDRATGQCK